MDAGGYGEGLESQAGPVKEKKTRKRLRLSCVECTKRRQKCDRKYPCGLCVSRGVPHLCRWENVPVARPAPARPPTIPEVPVAGPSSTPSSSVNDAKDQLIQDLQSKVAALEKRLHEQQHHQSQSISPIAGPSNSSSSSPSVTGSSPSATRSLALTHITTPSPSPAPLSLSDQQLELLPMHPPSEAAPDPPDQAQDPRIRDPFAGPLCHLGPGTYATTSALAQLCLGHFGEFTGRGSLVCALHFISTGNTPRFLYAKSTESTTSCHPTEMTSQFLVNRMEHIINTLPSRTLSTLLARRFFDEANYLFGIPEEWWWKAFGAMWDVLERPGPHGMHVNANFLVLFFAVMAYVPDPGSTPPDTGQHQYLQQDYEELSNRYFIAALEARRVAEDNHLNLPNLSLMVSAADGTVLTCLAIPILATWLSQRGRMSEGWKLVGLGLRSALGVGLHRDPEWGQWLVMSEEEKGLRRRAWWGLWVRDKLYSFLLGRQHMVRPNSFDVQLPSSSSSSSPTTNATTSFDSFALGLEMMISLAKLAGTVIETCFSMQLPPEETYWNLDGELEMWEENLAPILKWGTRLPGSSATFASTSHHPSSTSSSSSGPKHTLWDGFSPHDLDHIQRTRYLLTTWCTWMRVKVWIACLGRPGLGWEVYREAGRRCVELCLRLGGMQCGVYEGVKAGLGSDAGAGEGHGGMGMGGGGGQGGGREATPASIGPSTYPGPVWFFEGCFSLLESIAILLTMLTRHPWPEKVLEADQLAKRAIGVLEDVERWQTGRQGEVARLGVKVLRTLRREDWWESQVGGGEATRVPEEGWEGWEPSLLLGTGASGGGASGRGGGGEYGMLGGYDALASEVYTNEFGFRNSMFMP